jgi:serine/threonine protein kinase
MPAPPTLEGFLDLVLKSGLVDPEHLDAALKAITDVAPLPTEPKELAAQLVAHGVLTFFQAEQLLQGKWRGFTVGKYRLLERLGAGGMGIVFLCQHPFMQRLVAIKILPAVLAADPVYLKLFYQEAQALAALDHPNIVHAHDIDQAGNLHFLVMEYVDGFSLQEVVDTYGPLDVLRAAHYLRQAALGLQHAFERGLVHRDIKPSNLLLDRQGTIKILDMGLARLFDGKPSKAAPGGPRPSIVGTDDYLAPEQIINSDEVDIRADVYSLGATFYFLLTGRTPFEDVPLGYQKLIQHLGRTPKPVRELRPEVPEELAALVQRLMAKNPWERPRTPAAVVELLAPWTPAPAPPPPPPPPMATQRLSPAAARLSSAHLASRLGRAVGAPEGGSWVLPKEAQVPGSQTAAPAGEVNAQSKKSTAVVQATYVMGKNGKKPTPAPPGR